MPTKKHAHQLIPSYIQFLITLIIDLLHTFLAILYLSYTIIYNQNKEDGFLTFVYVGIVAGKAIFGVLSLMLGIGKGKYGVLTYYGRIKMAHIISLQIFVFVGNFLNC